MVVQLKTYGLEARFWPAVGTYPVIRLTRHAHAKRMDESYGRFAWIYDLDGNKIELWQPLPAKP